jgi:hypothetical protein
MLEITVKGHFNLGVLVAKMVIHERNKDDQYVLFASISFYAETMF